jgi:bidirectional [NiFe] hydrogenase diaphorase subunit
MPDVELGFSQDPAFGELEPILKRHSHQADGLIEVLNSAQQHYGYLSKPLLRHLAQCLQLPLSRIQGTASFYHLFRFQPPARHMCLVCTGTACHVKGAAPLLTELKSASLRELGIELGTVRCVGTCSGAPLVMVDGEVWNHQSGASVLQKLRELA